MTLIIIYYSPINQYQQIRGGGGIEWKEAPGWK